MPRERSGARLPWMLVGAGGHAHSVFDVITRRRQTLAGVCADSGAPEWLPRGCATLSEVDIETWAVPARWLIAIGDAESRARLIELVRSAGHRLGVLVAETATVASDAALAPGVMVLEHAHVGPGALIESGTIINTSAVVEHDCFVGAYSHVAPRAVILGSARVGSRVFVGSGAVVLPGVPIADSVVVGAGAVVTRPVATGVTVRGVPARTTSPL